MWYRYPFSPANDEVRMESNDPLVSSAYRRSSESPSTSFSDSSEASEIGQLSTSSTETKAQQCRLGYDSSESVQGAATAACVINPSAMSGAINHDGARPLSYETFDSIHQNRDGSRLRSSVGMTKISEKRKRFLKTVALLKSSGLLETSLRTAQLLRENNALQKELDALKRETSQFVSSVRKCSR